MKFFGGFFPYIEAVSACRREQMYELMDLYKHADRGEVDGLVLPGMETRSITLPQSCSATDHHYTFPHSSTKMMKFQSGRLVLEHNQWFVPQRKYLWL